MDFMDFLPTPPPPNVNSVVDSSLADPNIPPAAAAAADNINAKLPNECLAAIFDRIRPAKLSELLTLGLVCHRWLQVSESVIALKRSLFIHDGWSRDNWNCLQWTFVWTRPGLDDYVQVRLPNDDDGVNRFESKFALRLIHHLPLIEHLVFMVDELGEREDGYRELANFLQQHSPSLVSLSLIIPGDGHRSSNNVYRPLFKPLIPALNSMANLRHLQLLPPSETAAFILGSLDESFVKRLISICMDDEVLLSNSSILHLLGSHCARLWIDGSLHSSQFVRFAPRNPAVTHFHCTLSSRYLQSDAGDCQDFTRALVERFGQLRVLSLSCHQLKAFFTPPNISHLSRLTQLHDLRLDWPRLDPAQLTAAGSCLPTVRRLCLSNVNDAITGDDPFDGETFCRTLAAVFPNLERFLVTDCRLLAHLIRRHLGLFGRLQSHSIQ